MEIQTHVQDFIKMSIHLKKSEVPKFLNCIKDVPIDEKTATDLLWIVLSTVDYFYDDFDTIAIEPSMEVILPLVNYCIEKGAKVDGYVTDQTIDLESIYQYFETQCTFIRHPSISPLVLAVLKKEEALVSLILSQKTSMNIDEFYMSFHMLHQDHIVRMPHAMRMMETLISHVKEKDSVLFERVKPSILDKILNANDLIGWEYYLKHHFSVNDDLYIPAIILCRSKAISLRLIEFLHKNFIQQYVTPHGNTLLHLACRAGHEQMVRVLLKKGIDWNKVNRHGETAMFWACKNGNPYIVYRLLKKGVRQSYETLIGYADRFNRPTVRKVILEFKYAKKWYKFVKRNILLKHELFKGMEPMLVWKMVELASNS